MRSGRVSKNSPRMASIQTERGTWKTEGAALMNHRTASAALDSIAFLRVSAHNVNVKIDRCALTNAPTGFATSRPRSY